MLGCIAGLVGTFIMGHIIVYIIGYIIVCKVL